MTPIPGLYTHPQFLPPDLLIELRHHIESSEGDPAAVQREPHAPLTIAGEIRRAWEVELPDHLHTRLLGRIEQVRGDLEAFFGLRVQPCASVAALRYPPGSFYRTHRDASAHYEAHGLHRRAISVVIFLNSAAPEPSGAFTGGRLRFHEVPDAGDEPRDVVPVAGTLVAFRSSLLHEVTPVESGTRATVVAWLLTSDEAGRKRRWRRMRNPIHTHDEHADHTASPFDPDRCARGRDHRRDERLELA